MNNSEWISKYNEINDSFKKTLVFRVGIQAGLFSELNHMFLAILFCLQNKIRFVLSSRDSNFSYDKGWQDYFLPFCEETNAKYHLKYNARSYQIKNSIRNLVRSKMIRTVHRIDFLTQDIWIFIRDPKFHHQTFNFPELGINGNLISSLEVVVNHIWQYQPEIASVIQGRINGLALPPIYAAMHIRAGDKITEAQLSPVQEYICFLEKRSCIKNLFIHTDDYHNIIELKRNFKQYKISTFCRPDEKGFSEAEYNLLVGAEKKDITVKLLLDTEVSYRSSMFIGTHSSNVGLFIGMRRNGKEWYGVDANNWRIW